MQSIVLHAIPASSSRTGSYYSRIIKNFANCLLFLAPLLVMSCQKKSSSAPTRPEQFVSYIGDWDATGPNNFGSGEYQIHLQLRSNNQCAAKVTNNTKIEDALFIPLTETVNLKGTWEITGQTITTIFTVAAWNNSYPAGTPGGGATGHSKDLEFTKYEIKSEWNIADGKFDYKGGFFKIHDEKPAENGMSTYGSAEILIPFPKFIKAAK